MKSNNLAKIPPNPMVIQCIMPCRWTHLPNTWCQGVCACPHRFNIFANCSSHALHVAQVEIFLTRFPVPIDMPPRDCHVNLSCVGDSHTLWEFFHTHSEVFRPLTDDVVRDNDSEKSNANEGGKGNEVNITIPR
jgi:hypothetical protein